jgi:hypothetical protein
MTILKVENSLVMNKYNLMKNIFIVLLMVLSMNTFGQLALKFGVVKSNFSISNDNSKLYESSINPLFGGFTYQIKPLGIVGVETGLLYTGLVQKTNGGSLGLPEIKNHYLIIPVTVNFFPKSFISPGIGLHLSSLLNSSVKEIFNTKTFDAAAVAKLNINLLSKLGVELGYNFGIVPFTSIEITDVNGVVIKNNDFRNRFLYLAAKIGI